VPTPEQPTTAHVSRNYLILFHSK